MIRRHSTSASGSARCCIVLVDRVRMHPRPHVAAVVRAVLVEHDQLFGSRDRQLPQQDLVDQREDRRIGPDAERQRQDRHGGKQRTPPQSADRKTEVGRDGGHAGCLDGIGAPEVCMADVERARASWASASRAMQAVSLRRMRAPLPAM